MHPIERLRYVARAGDEDPVVIAEEAALALGALSFDRRALVPASRRLLEFHPTCGPLWWAIASLLVAEDIRDEVDRIIDQLSYDPTGEELASSLPSRALVASAGGRVVLDGLSMRPDLEIRLVDRPRALRSALRSLGLSAGVSGWDLEELEEAVADAQVVLVEALAAGPTGCVVEASAGALARQATQIGLPIWAVTGIGRLLPGPLFETLLEKSKAKNLDAAVGNDLVGEDEAGFDLEESRGAPGNRPAVLVPSAAIARVIGPRGPAATGPGLAHATCPAPLELLGSLRVDG